MIRPRELLRLQTPYRKVERQATSGSFYDRVPLRTAAGVLFDLSLWRPPADSGLLKGVNNVLSQKTLARGLLITLCSTGPSFSQGWMAANGCGGSVCDAPPGRAIVERPTRYEAQMGSRQ